MSPARLYLRSPGPILLLASLLAVASGPAMARTSGDASLPAPDMATALMQRSGDAMDSPWYQAEKALYRRLLARQQASVLIVPF